MYALRRPFCIALALISRLVNGVGDVLSAEDRHRVIETTIKDFPGVASNAYVSHPNKTLHVPAFLNEFAVVIRLHDSSPLTQTLRDSIARGLAAQHIVPHISLVQGMWLPGAHFEKLEAATKALRKLIRSRRVDSTEGGSLKIEMEKALIPSRPEDGANLFLDVAGARVADSIALASDEHVSSLHFDTTAKRGTSGFCDILTQFLCREAPPSGPIQKNVQTLDEIPSGSLSAEFGFPGAAWRRTNVITERLTNNRPHVTVTYRNSNETFVQTVNEVLRSAGLSDDDFILDITEQMIEIWSIDLTGNLVQRVSRGQHAQEL